MIRKIGARMWKDVPSVGVAAFVGLAGVGFAGANLLLARWLPKVSYGSFTLAVALINLGIMVAPLGATGMVNRRRIEPDTRLLLRTFATSAFVAIVLTGIASLVYDLERMTSLLLVAGVAVGGVTLVSAAGFQSRQRFPAALMIWQGGNFMLLLAAILVPIAGIYEIWFPLAVFVIGKACLGVLGWGSILRRPGDFSPAGDPEPQGRKYPWIESLSYTGIVAGTLILITLERLIVPTVLDLESLATFGVLAAIAGSPYRMLQMGVGYALLPRMKAASSTSERNRVFRTEILVAGTVGGIAAVGIWFLAPWLVELVAPGKYSLPPELVMAAIVAGFAKVSSTICQSVVEALGSTRELFVLNLTGWIAVGVAVAGAVVGARWGLTGVIYGVALGWLVQMLAAARIGIPKLGVERELQARPLLYGEES